MTARLIRVGLALCALPLVLAVTAAFGAMLTIELVRAAWRGDPSGEWKRTLDNLAQGRPAAEA
jgi:hypothetical protein